MYVDGDRLFLVVEKRDSEIVETTQNGDFGMDDFYNAVVYTDTTDSTQLLTYDISGSKEGKLLGSVTVDGSCETSRKVGDMIYLFTSRYVAGQTDGDDGVIPQVNGGKISADCIFIQENAKKEFIMVSVDTNKPNETVDQLVLLDAGVEVYMGTDAIYLYQSDYQEDASYTDITKFYYKDGYMDAVAAASVVGTIQDRFAISEKDGILRVLTTDWTKEESENRLYLLDENLKRKGLLKDLAAGEEIYAARYIGDIAYFITYHNTDPLFEMTGFSDYLHPFGENLLLGIGYETDPETSEQQGVKLTMFDISDPLNLKIVDSVIMEGDYCAAASNYKCALVDVKKNLIGFEVVDYGESIKQNYVVYSWNNNHFSRKMQKDLEEKYSEDKIRGLYAGSRFYLIYGKEIHSFDMERKWKKIEVLQL
jgi:hypothetical protein